MADRRLPMDAEPESLTYAQSVDKVELASRVILATFRIGERTSVALPKGTVPFSSNENRDSPPLIHSPILTCEGVLRLAVSRRQSFARRGLGDGKTWQARLSSTATGKAAPTP
jgi:hypothetical protein